MHQLELMPLGAAEPEEAVKLSLDEEAAAELAAAMVQAMLAVLRAPGTAGDREEGSDER